MARIGTMMNVSDKYVLILRVPVINLLIKLLTLLTVLKWRKRYIMEKWLPLKNRAKESGKGVYNDNKLESRR